ncbi:hypothetical protein QZH41_019714, partial [Actinostola sp. cb2023]
MGCITSKCLGKDEDYEGIPDLHNSRPVMRMCAPGKDAANFADVGDKVILYVDFGEYCSPCHLVDDTVEHASTLDMVRATAAGDHEFRGQERYEHEVMIAGQLTKLINLHPAVSDSKAYKAFVTIKLPDNPETEGQCVPVRLPYLTTGSSSNENYAERTETDIDAQYAVHFQSLWSQLKAHNNQCQQRNIVSRSSSMGRYGSVAPRQPGAGFDQPDGSGRIDSVEREAIRYEDQRRENQLPKPQRYWPDSWQMKCWRKNCCSRILRSNKFIPKFIATFFVAPLTNVTGLSLYYQLYLSEIFHTKFWTRLIHYFCMPLIVLMMLIFFTQWRFVFDNDANDCYKTNNFEVLIWNGALFLAVVFFIWYLIWGVVQKTFLMGIFMIGPLIILVLLANIYFQVSIKNSLNESYACNVCWNHTVHAGGMIQYYHIFDGDLMKWYYNPVLWVCVLSVIQSSSHMFEPKIPPRVSQTAHWMSCSHMCKRLGCTKALCILSAQAIFGAVDEGDDGSGGDDDDYDDDGSGGDDDDYGSGGDDDDYDDGNGGDDDDYVMAVVVMMMMMMMMAVVVMMIMMMAVVVMMIMMMVVVMMMMMAVVVMMMMMMAVVMMMIMMAVVMMIMMMAVVFLASPRLLPIFVLRMCYELGYHHDEWKRMKKLVKKCSEYGDPALDYIGVGGSGIPSTSSVVSLLSTTP